MRTFVLIAGSALLLAGCTPAPAPVESGQARELLETWMGQGNKLIELAEEFPAEKYDYQPTEDVRTFGEMLHHIAVVHFRYIRQEQGRPFDREEFNPEKFTTKEDYVNLLKRAYQEGAELLQPKTDAQMLEPVKNPYGDYTSSRYAFWTQSVEHAAEHYGNLVTYYRLNGLVPPASRSGSGG